MSKPPVGASNRLAEALGEARRLEDLLGDRLEKEKAPRRTRTLGLRLSDAEFERLEATAKAHEVPTTTLARHLIMASLDTMKRSR